MKEKKREGTKRKELIEKPRKWKRTEQKRKGKKIRTGKEEEFFLVKMFKKNNKVIHPGRKTKILPVSKWILHRNEGWIP